MKNIVFIVSHLGSGSENLIQILNNHPRIEIKTLGIRWSHPDDLPYLTALRHKHGTTAAIYGDHILYNENFSCKSLYNSAKFIYFIRSAEALKSDKVTRSYYQLRLRRIYEMAYCTPGSVLLTYDHLKKGLPLVENYLRLKPELVYETTTPPKEEQDVSLSVLNKSQDYYESYLHAFKKIGVRMVY